jgi:transcriptional regulator with XRE-family HTH domain
MKNYRQIFGQNVRRARKALALSQEQLALEVDLDRTYISGIERGVRNPSLDVIAKIAKRLKMTPGLLLSAE